jgi:signal transduction histidine kinase
MVAGTSAAGFLAVVGLEEGGLIPHLHASFGAHWPEEARAVLTGGTVLLFGLFAVIAGMAAGHLRELMETVDRQRCELREAVERERGTRESLVLLGRMVQHDVYGPLAFFGAACEWLEEEIRKGVSEEALRIAGMMRRRIQAVEGAVATLREFSEVRGQGEQTLTDVGVLVGEVVDDLQGDWEERQVKMKVASGPWPRVRVGRPQLYHVVRNVISNAIKWAPEGGSGEVRVMGGDAEGENWWIVIEDNGPGVEWSLGAVGGRKGDNDSRPTGLGVGLRLSREIARSWGGEIRCARAMGGGASFSIGLPKERLSWES